MIVPARMTRIGESLESSVTVEAICWSCSSHQVAYRYYAPIISHGPARQSNSRRGLEYCLQLGGLAWIRPGTLAQAAAFESLKFTGKLRPLAQASAGGTVTGTVRVTVTQPSHWH